MRGNSHVQFLGEGVTATSPPYPTPGPVTTRGHPVRRIKPLVDTLDSRGQLRSDLQTARLFVPFCGAGSSPPVVSTALARALEVKSAGLSADFEPWTAVRPEV